MKTLKAFNQYLDKVLFVSVSISTSIFFLSVLLTIINRYFNLPIQSTIEISRLFFIWACFLAAVITYRNKAHVAISFFTDKLKPQIREFFVRFSAFITIIFFALMLWYGFSVTVTLWSTEFPMLKISQGWLYLSVPVASMFFITYSVEVLLNPPSP